MEAPRKQPGKEAQLLPSLEAIELMVKIAREQEELIEQLGQAVEREDTAEVYRLARVICGEPYAKPDRHHPPLDARADER